MSCLTHCSLGLGVLGNSLYSYVLRVRSAFRLAEWTVKLPRDVFIGAIRNSLAGGNFLRPLLDILPPPPIALGSLDVANPRGLEVVFDSLNTDECFVRRRWLTDNNIDLHIENKPNPLCAAGAVGVRAAAEVALTALMGTPPWALIPLWPAIVGAQKVKLDASSAANPQMTAGEMLAMVLGCFLGFGR